ncbi:MAG: hypothetical protein VKM92_09840 [Cyanobacteriota bacterium]|nr:hypothetical protein [Cyanobacteriota bacterium]
MDQPAAPETAKLFSSAPATATTPSAASPHSTPPAPGAAGLGGDQIRQLLRHPVGAAGWLLQHRHGLLHQQLTEAMAAVLLACRDTEKPGEITLKIRVRPNPDYLGQMLISDQLVARPPAQATASAYLFDADALRLHGEEEGQLSIPLAG